MIVLLRIVIITKSTKMTIRERHIIAHKRGDQTRRDQTIDRRLTDD